MTHSVLPSVRLRRTVLCLTACLLAAGCLLHLAPPAQANVGQISIMMDDNQLVYAPDSVQRAALLRMATLGVNWVRATVLWSVVAYHTRDPRRDHAFDPANPRDYPYGNFADYDRLVTDAAQYGITVYFNITGPGPAWAMGKTRDASLKKSYLPDPTQFGKFVQAVGTRYSGNYPNGAGKPGNLPAMRFWSIWNEPNWPGWLAPQSRYDAKLRRSVPYAPVLYRHLYYAARRGLDASGHKNDFVMLGETAPLGGDPAGGFGPLRPGEFLRDVFCVDRSIRPLRGATATSLGCADFAHHQAFRVSAYAHHPYTHSFPPTYVDPSRDAFTLGNLGQLPTLLDRIAAATHRLPARLPILVTEMGYSTNPPNPFRGIPLATQLAYMNESDYLAYKLPRVLSMTQFEFRDSPPVSTAKRGSRAYWATFQTGLEFDNGRQKCEVLPPFDCSFAAYALPIFVRAGRDSHGHRRLELWAQVRFRRYPTPKDLLEFQYQAPGSTSWKPMTPAIPLASAATTTTPASSSYGFVDTSVPTAPYSVRGRIRAVWAGPVAPAFAFSREAAVP